MNDTRRKNKVSPRTAKRGRKVSPKRKSKSVKDDAIGLAQELRSYYRRGYLDAIMEMRRKRWEGL